MINATYSEFDSFPSNPDDQYRSVKATVATEHSVEEDWLEVDADFTLADGRGIAALSLGVFGTPSQLATEIESALSDLEFFKARVDDFYETAKDALKEARQLAG